MGSCTQELVRLNLGSGPKKWPGFINIDLAGNWSGQAPDVEADVRKLPFPDNYADEAHAIHVLEHMYYWEAPDVVQEWKRVLKPGGLLVVEVPCLEKILYWFTQRPIGLGKTLWGLYGSPEYKDPAMCHKWCYSVAMLEDLLIKAGLENVTEREPQFHRPQRDMRFEARKPNG
jgi:predicted SAM-dependent methyltransferase